MQLPQAALRHVSVISRRQGPGHLGAAAAAAARSASAGQVKPSWRTCSSSPLARAGTPGQRRSYATATTVSAAQLEFGQPVHETHPHILKAGEITPGISAQEYADRRAALALNLPQDGDVAVLASADLLYRSGAVFFPFRQETNFMYLTGFLEPFSVAVIRRTGPNLGDLSFHLFCRPKDPRAEQWGGPWSGLQAAEDVFNADVAGDISQLDTLLPQLLQGANRTYTDIDLNSTAKRYHQQSTTARAVAATVAHHATSRNSSSTRPLQPLVNQLRAIKSPAEIANMRQAGRVSGRALTDAMRRAWTDEAQLQAFLEYRFHSDGCSGPAYVPVVAGGARGCKIHYVHNTAQLAADETVLVDAGGEYGGYVADITRVWPTGRGGGGNVFSAPQRDLYETVLRVQRAGVSLCRADAGLTLDQIHHTTAQALRDELKQLGFDFSMSAGIDVLFPHHVGHYVGLDVHDVPGYGRSCVLRAGHCVTIEPGVYVPVDDERWPKHFRGLAVRIEDSVCVLDDAPLNLTVEAVKEVVDIEALRNK
ncbi:peptidase M24, structural domain-containing protein [Lasiosphaeria ovina]|uniref:Xaa-Pro aminopeptidase n=1 Tax=Lasiosphaeria ovina TaxID=92902 RepID=A0AAE0NMR0_9PEZI|nr:peptidase M24, structural domain-containing protein [Lasiosphaeria ovina]